MCVPLAALACQLETCMEYPGSGNVGLTAKPCWKWQFWVSYTHYIPTYIYIHPLYNIPSIYIYIPIIYIYPLFIYTHYIYIYIHPLYHIPIIYPWSFQYYHRMFVSDFPHVKNPTSQRRGDRLWEPGVLWEQLRATEFPARLDLRSPGRRGLSEGTEQWLDVGRYGFVWKCWVYSQWNSHLIGIMIINHWV